MAFAHNPGCNCCAACDAVAAPNLGNFSDAVPDTLRFLIASATGTGCAATTEEKLLFFLARDGEGNMVFFREDRGDGITVTITLSDVDDDHSYLVEAVWEDAGGILLRWVGDGETEAQVEISGDCSGCSDISIEYYFSVRMFAESEDVDLEVTWSNCSGGGCTQRNGTYSIAFFDFSWSLIDGYYTGGFPINAASDPNAFGYRARAGFGWFAATSNESFAFVSDCDSETRLAIHEVAVYSGQTTHTYCAAPTGDRYPYDPLGLSAFAPNTCDSCRTCDLTAISW